MTIFWKDINLILNPDPELTRLPPVVIPQCQKDLFKRTCEKVWAEQVILPWLQKKMQGTGTLYNSNQLLSRLLKLSEMNEKPILIS